MKRALAAAKQKREGSTVLRGSALGAAIGYAESALAGKKVSAPLFHAVKLAERDELEVKAHPAEADAVERFMKEHGATRGSSEAIGKRKLRTRAISTYPKISRRC